MKIRRKKGKLEEKIKVKVKEEEEGKQEDNRKKSLNWLSSRSLIGKEEEKGKIRNRIR